MINIYFIETVTTLKTTLYEEIIKLSKCLFIDCPNILMKISISHYYWKKQLTAACVIVCKIEF